MRATNVLIVNPDQWRGDHLGYAGHPAVSTPVLDAWVAREAVGLRQAYVQNPVCTPSRCSFMTGWYPHVRGHRTMHHMLRPDEPCLLRVLKDAGWQVWWGGKNDLVPAQDGFAAYCHERFVPSADQVDVRTRTHRDIGNWRGDPAGDNWYSFLLGRLDCVDPELGCARDFDHAVVDAACGFLRDAPRDRPFCAFLALHNPHPPYAVEPPWHGRTPRERIPEPRPRPADWLGKPALLRAIAAGQRLDGWSPARIRELRGVYADMCARVDHQVGMLLEALRASGRYDDTLVLVFSDHGDFTGDYGLVEKTQNTFEDCLVRVPCAIKPPAGVACAPGMRDALVELVDVPATVYDLCGLRPRYTHFGRSLRPLLAADVPHRDAVFAEGGRLAEEEHCSEAQSTTGSPDPTASLYWPRLAAQRSVPEHGKALMCRTATHKLVTRLYEEDELYDLQADPGEVVNRIGDPSLRAVRDRLRERSLRFLVETADAVPWDGDRR